MQNHDSSLQVVTLQPTQALQMMPQAEMVAYLQQLERFVHDILKPDIHYSRRRGYDKPALEKPGAEVLFKAFICRPRFVQLPTTFIDHQGQYAYLAYKCEAVHIQSGTVFAEAAGSATSTRSGNEGKEWGWILNSVDKMAQKSALIACALLLGAASQHFTQDIEAADDEESSLRCPQHHRKLREWSNGRLLKCTKKLEDGSYCQYEIPNPAYAAPVAPNTGDLRAHIRHPQTIADYIAWFEGVSTVTEFNSVVEACKGLGDLSDEDKAQLRVTLERAKERLRAS